MITNEESKINGDFYKKRRSISSKIGNNFNEEINNSRRSKSRHRKMASSYFLGSYVSGEELSKFIEEYKEINNDNNIKNKISDNEISEQSNLNNKKNNDINNLKDLLLNDKNSKTNNDNIKDNKIIPLTNTSFYSYSIEDENENKNKEKDENGSVIIKAGSGTGDESLTNNWETKSSSYINNTNNNPFYELEKNNEKFNKDKSFIPIKNGLKYLKDKEERVTDSYLMALNGGEANKNNNKNQYLPTASIIEEEKSEFIESTGKKQSIIKGNKLTKEINFKKKKIEIDFDLVKNNEDILEKSNEEENKENIDINIQNNINDNNKEENDNATVKKCPKLDFDLNRIKIKNEYKEEKKRKCLRKNKDDLLNSFYNLPCNKSNPINNSCGAKKEVNSIYNKKINYNQILSKNNKMIINNNINNFNKDKKKELIKSSSKSLIKLPLNIIHKKRNFSYSGGYISFLYHQRFNTENNAPRNDNTLKNNVSKYIYKKSEKNIIYNIYNNNCKEFHHKKKLNKSMNNQIFSGAKINPKKKIPHKKFDKSVINKNYDISRKNQKFLNNKAKILLDMSHRRVCSNSRDFIENNITHNKLINKDEKLNINYLIREDSSSSYNIKTNLDTSHILNHRKIINSKDNCNIPTYSDSHSYRSKEKIRDKIINNKTSKKKKLMRKANSGLLSTRYTSENENKNEIDISNKKQTFIILKEKIKFLKGYEKNDVLEKINRTLNCNKSSFIILCDINNDIFLFNGLYKYYENQKRFIKIYGNEKVPNVILTKSINISHYKIYESKIIQNEENKTKFLFEQINSFYFSFNSIIICKNKIIN